ncbi:hypothetical protein GCM10020255_078460 [Rhodococcus baikonurensis]
MRPRGSKKSTPDPFEDFIDYIRYRFSEDPHLWAVALFDELLALGFALSYPTMTRKIRQQKLRPICLSCRTATDRANAIIDHPPGEETQWDYVDLPNPPTEWGWGRTAHLWVGSLAHSGKWRAVLTPSMDQPHLVDNLDRVVRALGGITRVWRFDRMATVCYPESGAVTASFAGVAKYYGVSVAICPPRRGNRKGVVEKANHTAAQRWWRSLPDMSVEQAQAHLDNFCAAVSDIRTRHTPTEPAPSPSSLPPNPCRHRRHGVSGHPRRHPHGVAASVGVLPRKSVLRPAGAGVRAGHRHPPGR